MDKRTAKEVAVRHIRTSGVVVGAILGTFTIVLLTLVLWPGGRDVTMAEQDENTADMETATAVRFPPVEGFYAGNDILFAHTEASDEQIAETLTTMMGSPVLVVPELAEVPESALANVYVFTNGVKPEGAMGGPMGYQPDVFDSAPGDENYSPLRAVNLVTWADNAEPRVLRSADELLAAEESGELTIEQPDVVVNMPVLTWPDGHH
jgi:hypothetical protein